MACVTANIELLRDDVSASMSQTCTLETEGILFASDGLLIDNNGEAIYTNE